ncbi:transcription regulator [Abeliophyllum distichum]|uniref:Transcription regulator n=1 Tax=Abeliophyllum distichum TaxID=126358 RepID=A0ABD1RXC1_9LAMI
MGKSYRGWFPTAKWPLLLMPKNTLIILLAREAGKSVIEEYLKRRGHVNIGKSSQATPTSNLHAYVKPRTDEGPVVAAKKSQRAPKETMSSTGQENLIKNVSSESQNIQKGNQASSRKKKSGKVVSLTDAAKGSIVFQQGKPCSCQARRHRLISNCLSCGKIVCEQEGSTYGGLDEGAVPLSDTEVAAEAYAKRLVEYDRNSAARTTVIDDQNDYYEIEGNSWLSVEEKELLQKKREEIEEG